MNWSPLQTRHRASNEVIRENSDAPYDGSVSGENYSFFRLESMLSHHSDTFQALADCAPGELTKSVPHCSVSDSAQTIAIPRRYHRSMARQKSDAAYSVLLGFMDSGGPAVCTKIWRIIRQPPIGRWQAG